jgi:hypothetical protein
LRKTIDNGSEFIEIIQAATDLIQERNTALHTTFTHLAQYGYVPLKQLEESSDVDEKESEDSNDIPIRDRYSF